MKKCLVFFVCFLGQEAFGYQSFTHEHLTRGLFSYVNQRPENAPFLSAWLSEKMDHASLLEELLVRANVDSNYKSDVWFQSWLHAPTTGEYFDPHVEFHTRLSHYLVVKNKGKFWRYDGFSYETSSKEGRDRLFDFPSVRVDQERSSMFGGDHPSRAYPLPPFRYGFKGTDLDWDNNYGEKPLSQVIFPPAFVGGSYALQAILESKMSKTSFVDHWDEFLNLSEGTIATKMIFRHYARAQIEGLPEGMDQLGLLLHLAQDLTVPHHVIGTTDLCHRELEEKMDELDSGLDFTQIDQSGYQSGVFFGSDRNWKSHLYNEGLITKILEEMKPLELTENSARNAKELEEFLVQLAELTAKWTWSRQGAYLTTLPSGESFQEDSCQELLLKEAIEIQLKSQYHQALAVSLVLVESVFKALFSPKTD